ncbi:aspartate carbamoyltransferase catalytic subunit [Bacillus carboniphilus]|uniref:Aspartate carbamoyltransferase n=1 Tax=Bacillus carboniphilus TaxID=86663 RepID=A0ABP3G126_9BACI
MRHIVSMEDFSTREIHDILSMAKAFEEQRYLTQNNQVLVSNLFFEASTRTKLSFEVAQRKLQLQVIPFEVSTSSVQKGETLYDTVKTLEAIGCNMLVIRHPENDFYKTLLDHVEIPIINAGDGSGQHPSQCLLDLYTIQKEFGRFVGLKVMICGDLKHSRVARSNAKALSMLGAEVYFSSPDEWKDENLLGFGKYVSVDEAIEEVDVVMMLRVQLERHAAHYSLETYHDQYGLTVDRAKKMKPDSIIMHPAPVNRGVEISDELVEAPQSRIFEQMKNGVFVRMAMMETLLQKWGRNRYENIVQERQMV